MSSHEDPTKYLHISQHGAEYPEDPSLKDVNHLAETIRNVCNLNIGDPPSDQGLSKEHVVEVDELVEKELLCAWMSTNSHSICLSLCVQICSPN